MPGDLAIAPVSSVGLTHKSAPAHATKSPEQQTSGDQTGQGTATAPTAASPVLPNPSLSIDPGLGLVVMEFRNGAGKVTDTIPTQKQLDTYRQVRLQDHTPGSDMSGTGKASASTSAGEPPASARTDLATATAPITPVSRTASAGAVETQSLPALANPAATASDASASSSPPQAPN